MDQPQSKALGDPTEGLSFIAKVSWLDLVAGLNAEAYSEKLGPNVLPYE